MRSRHSRPRTALSRVPSRVCSQRGFSMAELLVTIVVAGVVFAAMVPFFANALSRTSEDEVRVDGNTIAQDRIEQVRLLDFSDITTPNLNYSPSPTKSPFGDGRFGTSYTLYGEARPYTVRYEVTTPSPSGTATADPSSAYKKVIVVTVSRQGSTYTTTAQTVVRDPAAGTTSVVDAEPTGLSITAYYVGGTWQYVTGAWITRVQTNVTPNATTTPAPGVQLPTAAVQESTWTGLTGGPNYWYKVWYTSSKQTGTRGGDSFHLWGNIVRKPIDAYPGGD
jgi:prepilin-type N-terminal cleavage/methylation domain-containing protein